MIELLLDLAGEPKNRSQDLRLEINRDAYLVDSLFGITLFYKPAGGYKAAHCLKLLTAKEKTVFTTHGHIQQPLRGADVDSDLRQYNQSMLGPAGGWPIYIGRDYKIQRTAVDRGGVNIGIYYADSIDRLDIKQIDPQHFKEQIILQH